MTERNLERFEALAADKGYDDRSYRNWLRACGKRPLIKHREFAPYDKAANARMDEKLYHRRSLVGDGDLGHEAQVWRGGEQPSVVEAVSRAGGHVPGSTTWSER